MFWHWHTSGQFPWWEFKKQMVDFYDSTIKHSSPVPSRFHRCFSPLLHVSFYYLPARVDDVLKRLSTCNCQGSNCSSYACVALCSSLWGNSLTMLTWSINYSTGSTLTEPWAPTTSARSFLRFFPAHVMSGSFFLPWSPLANFIALTFCLTALFLLGLLYKKERKGCSWMAHCIMMMMMMIRGGWMTNILSLTIAHCKESPVYRKPWNVLLEAWEESPSYQFCCWQRTSHKRVFKGND